MGVNIRRGKKKETITLDFSYNGLRCRESLKGFKVNQTNIESAEKKLVAIEYAIEQGTFDYTEHFPFSKRSAMFGKGKTKEKLVGDAVDQWLSIQKTKLQESTFVNYRSKVKTYIKPAFANCAMSEITLSDIQTWMAVDLNHLSNKTINETLIIMRAIFDIAAADRVITESPLKHLKNLKVLAVQPDPFSKKEIETILNTPTNRDQEINMIEFNFWTGLRPSELIALSWEDIDQINWTAKIQLAKVSGKFKTVKTTKSERTVELLSPAIQALKRQLDLSYSSPTFEIKVTQSDVKTIKKQQWHPVFLNSNTQEPHETDAAFRSRFWTTHLKKANVRSRPLKMTRHTYASQLLSTGKISKDWIAKQMGHTSTRMLEKHYAKWISEDAPAMAEMVNDALGFKNC